MIKQLSSEKGVTLIELLVTLTITAIITGIIYGVFATGLKLYQKIGIEGQLRDDADYTATMILNEMYNSPPNYITEYTNSSTGAKGIQMVRYKPKVVNEFIVENSTEIEQNILIYLENGKFYIEKLDGNNQSIGKTQIQTDKDIGTSAQEGETSESSSITIGSCSVMDSDGKCQHGRIILNLILQNSSSALKNFIQTKPLILKSSFGF